MKIKYNRKKIIALVGASATFILASGCGNNERKMITETVQEVQDTTCFDEVCEEDLLEKIDSLEEYLKYSNLLDTLNFKRKECNLQDYTLYTPEELRQLICEYTTSKKKELFSETEFKKIEDSINAQEKLVNHYIYKEGYEIMEQATISAVKAKLLDAQGLDEESYNSVTLPNVKSTNIYEECNFYFYLGEYKIHRDSNLGKLYKSVYEMQQKGTENAPVRNCYEYNKDRNTFIENALDNLDSTLRETYEVNQKNVLKRVKN